MKSTKKKETKSEEHSTLPAITPTTPDRKNFLGYQVTEPEPPDLKSTFEDLRTVPELSDFKSTFEDLRTVPELPDFKSMFEGLRTVPELPDFKSTFEDLRTVPELSDFKSTFEGLRTVPELPDFKSMFEGLRTVPELPDFKSMFEGLGTVPELPDFKSRFEGLRAVPELPDFKSMFEGLGTVPELPDFKSTFEGLRTVPELSDTGSTLESLTILPQPSDYYKSILGDSDSKASPSEVDNVRVIGADLHTHPYSAPPPPCNQVTLKAEFNLCLDLAPAPQPINGNETDPSSDSRHYVLLRELERRLRSLVKSRLLELVGPNWIKQRVPQAVRERWQERQNEDRADGRLVYEEIEYADFMDLSDIIVRKNNWREAFQDIFRDREDIGVSLRRIHPVRKALAHCRPLSQMDILTLITEASRIFERLDIRTLH